MNVEQGYNNIPVQFKIPVQILIPLPPPIHHHAGHTSCEMKRKEQKKKGLPPQRN
jgi:hypothetical protein